MLQQKAEYSSNDANYEGFVAYDDTSDGSLPVIILVHDWSGCRELVIERATLYAEQGFFAFAVDLFGKGKRGSSTDPKINAALIEPFVADRKKILTAMNAAMAWLDNEPRAHAKERVAIGFCFGGMCVLDLARSGQFKLSGVVSVHGLLNPPEYNNANPISTKVLALHGYKDKMAPPEVLAAFQEEMQQANADWQTIAYGEAMHAFTNPEANSPEYKPEANPPSFGVQYSPITSNRAWKHIDVFLEELFFVT